jgi:hypothetical protein
MSPPTTSLSLSLSLSLYLSVSLSLSLSHSLCLSLSLSISLSPNSHSRFISLSKVTLPLIRDCDSDSRYDSQQKLAKRRVKLDFLKPPDQKNQKLLF